jgi:hypothetical protein
VIVLFHSPQTSEIFHLRKVLLHCSWFHCCFLISFMFSHRNWIVQDVLRKGDPSHVEIIASCLRNHYVTLAKNKYSSNVVEWCLRVFHEGERSVIICEFINYPHFRDLVTDEFANFALSTALQTCEVSLQISLCYCYYNMSCDHSFVYLSSLFTMFHVLVV